MLNIWYSMVVAPAFDHCSPEFIQGRSTSTCECSLGFINPPSLRRVVYRFKNVSDCGDLGEMLSFFRNVLLAMFAVSAFLSILVVVFAAKRLNSLGVCGKSGVYVVTPDEQSGPTPISSNLNSQRPSASPSFSHRSIVAPSSSNYAISIASQRYECIWSRWIHGIGILLSLSLSHTHTHTHTDFTLLILSLVQLTSPQLCREQQQLLGHVWSALVQELGPYDLKVPNVVILHHLSHSPHNLLECVLPFFNVMHTCHSLVICHLLVQCHVPIIPFYIN